MFATVQDGCRHEYYCPECTRRGEEAVPVLVPRNATARWEELMAVREATTLATARRRAAAREAAAPDAATYWQLLMRVSNDAIFVLCGQYISVVEASQSLSDLLGYSLAELKGMHSWDWDVRRSREDVLKAAAEDMALPHGTRNFETQARRKDGAIIDVEVSASWISSHDGGRFVCTMRDVTERNARNKALREETKLRRMGIESSAEGIVILSLNDYRVIDANGAFARLLQREPWEVIGLHPWDWDAAHIQADVVALAEQADHHAPTRFETRWRRRDGTEIDIRIDSSYFEIDGKAFSYNTCRDITEQKAAERALSEEQRRLRGQTMLRHLAMESATDGIALMELDGVTVVEANTAFARMLGYAPDELIGLHPWDWDVHADRDEIVAGLASQRAGNAEPVLRFETIFRRRDGSTFDADVTLSFFELEGIAYTYAIFRDIAERKTADRALRDSEAKFRAMFDSTPRGIALCTRDGRHLESNPVVHAFTGKPLEATRGHFFWEGDWWSENDRSSLKDAMERAAAGEHVQLEITQQARDGRLITSHFTIAPILGADGEVAQLLVEASDITALKETQVELSRREQLLSAILTQTPGGVLLINERTYQIVEFNDSACAMHGYSREEFATLAVLDLKAAATDDLLQERKRRTIEEGQITFEDKHRRKDGSVVDVRVSLSRIHVYGEFHTVALWIDITDLKLTEQALRGKEEEVRTLVEHTPDGMVRYDRTLRRVYVNAAMAKFMGADAASLVGSRLIKPRSIVNPELYKTTLRETFRTGRSSEIEAQLIVDGLGPRWAQIRFAPELDADGQVATVLVIAHDVTEVVEQRQRVHQLAYSDPLTGLPNRTLFNERFGEAIKGASRRGESVGLLLLDLDRFKDINDSLGHAAGDDLLRQAAGRLTGCLRHGDVLARLGGDEFAVILSGVRNGEDAIPVADRVLQAFLAPFLICGQEIFASASIGIAIYPLDGTTPDDLFARADVAMYDAKKKGRGGVQFYAQELTAEAARRLALGTSLHSACANGELELFYQPKIRLRDNQLIGAEALLRWRHPDLGLLAPDAFIGIAEETGLIVEIGRWVLETACRLAVDWNQGRDDDPLALAVNLSSRQFMHNDIVADVRDALDRTRCQSRWLECEITESLILKDELEVHSALAYLSGMGISIAIDDFGTGQSALAYLNRFHVDVLKIDRSFIDRMETDPRKAELVKAFISIATALDVETVAEGIETQEQAELLQSFGCHIGQGYLLGKPMPAAEFERRFVGRVLEPAAAG